MSPASRSLRVGVVIHGQLVEERIFSGSEPVTFGQSLRCALSIPVDGVPVHHALFTRPDGNDGTFQLRTLDKMTGRLGHGDTIDVLDAGAKTIAVAKGTRGKLALGDVTILFQEIATPPPAPRPQLPASIRGTFADRIDRRLAVIIGASLVAHIAIAAWAWSADVDTTVLGERTIPAEYRVDTIDLTLPDFVQRVDPTTPPTTRPAVAPPVTPPHNITPTRTPTHAAATDPEQLAQDARRMANILTGDDGTHGFGGMAQRTPGADLNHQIDDARNRTITIGDNGHTSRVDDRARIGTDNHGLPIDDPMLTRTPDHVDHERPGRIVITPIPGETGTTLTPQMVLAKINGVYLAGLQRCYSLGQKDDATLEGKIAIELTVDIHGRVTDPSASGLTSKVDGCISNFMTTWHFTTPKDKSGEPTEATFKVALVLKRG
jgi:hypothetical protein